MLQLVTILTPGLDAGLEMFSLSILDLLSVMYSDGIIAQSYARPLSLDG